MQVLGWIFLFWFSLGLHSMMRCDHPHSEWVFPNQFPLTIPSQTHSKVYLLDNSRFCQTDNEDDYHKPSLCRLDTQTHHF